MRKEARRKSPDRRKTAKGAWMLGGALKEDRRKGPRDRRVSLKDRRRHI